MLDKVARLAGAMQSKGITKGDRVIIYMPMITEALVAMLACARIGAIHSVVFGGFAANELAVRIDDATPKAILAASCGLEPGRTVAYKPLIDGAIEIAEHKPETVFMFQREECVYLWDHMRTQGRCASNRRAFGRPKLDDEKYLQCGSRRCILGSVRCGLGRWSFLYLLCAIGAWKYDNRV